MDNNFEILERIKDDVQIIEINGELDAFVAPKLKETFNKLIEKDINKYIVDFKGLIHINSLAMGILRGKLQVVREMGGDIKIVNLNKHIQTIFETIGLDEIFEIYKNEDSSIICSILISHFILLKLRLKVVLIIVLSLHK